MAFLLCPWFTTGVLWEGDSLKMGPKSAQCGSSEIAASHRCWSNHIFRAYSVLFRWCRYVLYFFVGLYCLIPVIVRTNTWILPRLVFFNILFWPFHDLQNPSSFGLNGSRSFAIQSADGVQLGMWHMLPEPLHAKASEFTTQDFDRHLGDGTRIFYYLHGNSADRGATHRVALYQVLVEIGFHVVTIDYRGFGDSESVPHDEMEVLQDALAGYRWLKERAGKSPIYIWGHSLGTGIATSVAQYLCLAGDPPRGLVLESGFNNIREAAANHPFAKPYQLFPGFEWLFIDPIAELGIHLRSDENIGDVSSPVLILHAEDDVIVPFFLGQKLYAAAQQRRMPGAGPVSFRPFTADRRFGHKHIHKAPELPQIIR